MGTQKALPAPAFAPRPGFGVAKGGPAWSFAQQMLGGCQAAMQAAAMYGRGEPAGGKGPVKGGRDGHPGDWHCPNVACKNNTQNVCYASKEVCPLCGTPKPVGGAGYTEKKHPGDWACPNPLWKNATNFVYGSKAVCNLCGTPRPPDGQARGRSRSPRATH